MAITLPFSLFSDFTATNVLTLPLLAHVVKDWSGRCLGYKLKL